MTYWAFGHDMFTACHSPNADLHAVRFADYTGRLLRHTGPWRTVCGLDVRGPLTAAMFQQPEGNYLGDVVLSWPPPRDRRCPDCDRLTRPANGRDPHPRGAGSWLDLRDVPETTTPERPKSAPPSSPASHRVPGSVGGVKLAASGSTRRSSARGAKASTSSASRPRSTQPRSRSARSKS